LRVGVGWRVGVSVGWRVGVGGGRRRRLARRRRRRSAASAAVGSMADISTGDAMQAASARSITRTSRLGIDGIATTFAHVRSRRTAPIAEAAAGRLGSQGLHSIFPG
jgi:hypothetical protein